MRNLIDVRLKWQGPEQSKKIDDWLNDQGLIPPKDYKFKDIDFNSRFGIHLHYKFHKKNAKIATLCLIKWS